MAGKVGCGTLIAFLLVLFALVAVGSNKAVGYYFSHCDGLDLFDCLLGALDEPEPEPDGVVATGAYAYKGYSVTITMNIPLEGGAVTGSVSDTCDGTVKGTYNGQQNGVISGTLSGACSPFFVNIPAGAEFTGVVNKSSKTVPISFTGHGGGITHKGSMSLSYR